MKESKKGLYILFAILAFIITVEIYLFATQHYILASSIIIAICTGSQALLGHPENRSSSFGK